MADIFTKGSTNFRSDAGELADEELYCSDVQWCGLYDRMHTHKPDEAERRFALALADWQ